MLSCSDSPIIENHCRGINIHIGLFYGAKLCLRIKRIKENYSNKLKVDERYFKIYQQETEEVYSYEIDVELDLVKGVHVRYGWEPRR